MCGQGCCPAGEVRRGVGARIGCGSCSTPPRPASGSGAHLHGQHPLHAVAAKHAHAVARLCAEGCEAGAHRRGALSGLPAVTPRAGQQLGWQLPRPATPGRVVGQRVAAWDSSAAAAWPRQERQARRSAHLGCRQRQGVGVGWVLRMRVLRMRERPPARPPVGDGFVWAVGPARKQRPVRQRWLIRQRGHGVPAVGSGGGGAQRGGPPVQ